MTPYEGSKPYIFISYSHKDTDAVLSVINTLERNGFRVWFDAGVEAGSEWPEYIASHLRRSSCVLAFISPNFVASVNCRRELTFAQNLNIPMLNVYLSEVELSDGLQMQLGLNQCLFRNKFSTQDDFEEAVCRAEMLKSCRKAENETEDGSDSPAATKPSEADAVPITMKTPAEMKKDAKTAKALSWITSIIQLSYAFTGIILLDLISKNVQSGVAQFLWMILPGTLTTALSFLLFKTMGRDIPTTLLGDAMTGPAFFWFLGTLIAIIGGVFVIHTDAGIFMKILSVIGYNLLPGLLSLIMIGTMDE